MKIIFSGLRDLDVKSQIKAKIESVEIPPKMKYYYKYVTFGYQKFKNQKKIPAGNV